eukprot:8339148-Pyramimonas_sp.AAC.1
MHSGASQPRAGATCWRGAMLFPSRPPKYDCPRRSAALEIGVASRTRHFLAASKARPTHWPPKA